MKLTEILQLLHQMQKGTTKLLFEAQVSESDMIRKAVAKADLALGNAASLVRQQLSGTQRTDRTFADAKKNGRSGLAASQRSDRTPEKGVAAAGYAISTQEKEPALQAASVPVEDAAVEHEELVDLRLRDWRYLDVIQHPADRPNG